MFELRWPCVFELSVCLVGQAHGRKYSKYDMKAQESTPTSDSSTKTDKERGIERDSERNEDRERLTKRERQRETARERKTVKDRKRKG